IHDLCACFYMIRVSPLSSLFPYTTLFRSATVGFSWVVGRATSEEVMDGSSSTAWVGVVVAAGMLAETLTAMIHAAPAVTIANTGTAAHASAVPSTRKLTTTGTIGANSIGLEAKRRTVLASVAHVIHSAMQPADNT